MKMKLGVGKKKRKESKMKQKRKFLIPKNDNKNCELDKVQGSENNIFHELDFFDNEQLFVKLNENNRSSTMHLYDDNSDADVESWEYLSTV